MERLDEAEDEKEDTRAQKAGVNIERLDEAGDEKKDAHSRKVGENTAGMER